MRPDPKIVSNILPDEDFFVLKKYLFELDKSNLNQPSFGRFAADHNQEPILWEYTQKILPAARKAFGSDTLLPSYTLFCHYEGPGANLYKHKDDNACTYTLDMHVYYNENWDLWVENKAYSIPENGAAAFFGEEQEHWREQFPSPESNYLGAVFFHFVEPDHWWFQKEPSYLSVIRKEVSEEDWSSKNTKQ